MANTARAEVPVQINGQHYVLKFGAGFIRRMEEAYPNADGTPRPFTELFPRDEKGKPKVVHAIALRAVWCALQPHEFDRFPTLDVLEEEIGGFENMKTVVAAANEGIRKAFGTPARPPQAAPGTPVAAVETKTAAQPTGTGSSGEQP